MECSPLQHAVHHPITDECREACQVMPLSERQPLPGPPPDLASPGGIMRVVEAKDIDNTSMLLNKDNANARPGGPNRLRSELPSASQHVVSLKVKGRSSSDFSRQSSSNKTIRPDGELLKSGKNGPQENKMR